MAGLFEKDIRLMFNRKQLIIMMIIVAVVLGYLMEGSFVVGYLTFLGAIYALGTISYDEFDNGYAFLMTLPIDRRGYVMEKYLFCYSMVGCSYVVSMVVFVIMNLIKNTKMSLVEELLGGWMAAIICFILLSVMIPVRFKFGSEKSNIVLAVISGVIVAIVLIGEKILEKANISIYPFVERMKNISEGTYLLLMIIIGMIITVGSFFISKKIMEQKEF